MDGCKYKALQRQEYALDQEVIRCVQSQFEDPWFEVSYQQCDHCLEYKSILIQQR